MINILSLLSIIFLQRHTIMFSAVLLSLIVSESECHPVIYFCQVFTIFKAHVNGNEPLNLRNNLLYRYAESMQIIVALMHAIQQLRPVWYIPHLISWRPPFLPRNIGSSLIWCQPDTDKFMASLCFGDRKSMFITCGWTMVSLFIWHELIFASYLARVYLDWFESDMFREKRLEQI